jgi:hypothetical protein
MGLLLSLPLGKQFVQPTAGSRGYPGLPVCAVCQSAELGPGREGLELEENYANSTNKRFGCRN